MKELHYSGLLSIAAFMVLFSVLIWEVISDKLGEDRKGKVSDWFFRTAIVIGSAYVSEIIRIFELPLLGNFLAACFMAFAIHFLLFDYLIVIILKKNGVIKSDANPFTYLGKTANYPKWWLKCGPWGRFSIRLAVFAIALLIYF